MNSDDSRMPAPTTARRRSRRGLIPRPLRRAATVFTYFFRAEPWRGALMLTSMILAGLLEGIGIAALLPVLNTIVGGEQSQQSFIVRNVNHALESLGLGTGLGTLLLVIVVLITAKSLLLVLAAKQIGYTASTVTMRLRLHVLEQLMRARWSFFVRQRLGSISASVTTEPPRAASTYVQTARVMTGVFQLTVYFALAVIISLEVSIAAVVVGSISALLLNRFVTMTGKAAQQQTRLTKSLLSGLADGLQSMKPIKAMAREKQLSDILKTDIVAMNKAQQMQILARESLQHYREPITTAALAGGLYVILTQWNLEIENLLVMAFLFLRTIGKISSLQTAFQAIAGSLPSFWFVRSILSTAAVAAEKNTQGRAPRLTSAIRFENVSFAYSKAKQVLNNVRLEVPQGHFVALVGVSGSGKTTIGDLAIGLLQPTSGRVLLDDEPLSEIDQKAWRGMIGYVPQDTPLLHDTVLNNITLRDPDITAEEVRTALVRAGAWSFVSELPGDIHAVVGERGTRLSGGQRQRIAIARALAKRPALLILDEATAALDPQTEAEICKTLTTLVGELTILAISHQDALKDAADIVYRIENGTATRVDGATPQERRMNILT